MTGRGSFDEIILPHLDAAMTLARWLVRGAQDAEDVVQDAVARALTYYDTFRGENPRAWLLQIVRNVAFGSHKLNRGLTLMSIDAAAEIADPAPGPEGEAIARETGDRISTLIAGLPAELRETLILREIQELSYKDIARITDAPIGTVMSRLWRARRLLAAALGRRENVA
jgi:RNA polymerase sigma-70 factor (ECF subfamily)